jgi:hypothetical protein
MIQKNAFNIRFKVPGWTRRLLGLPAKSVKGSKAALTALKSNFRFSPDFVL